MDFLRKQAERLIQARKKHERWLKAFLCLSIVLLMILEPILGLDGIAMTHGEPASQQIVSDEKASDENETTETSAQDDSAFRMLETQEVESENLDENLEEPVTIQEPAENPPVYEPAQNEAGADSENAAAENTIPSGITVVGDPSDTSDSVGIAAENTIPENTTEPIEESDPNADVEDQAVWDAAYENYLKITNK